MPIYDYTANNFGPQMLPPDKRFTRMVAWIKALLLPSQYVRDLQFGTYMDGSTDPAWSAGTYALGARVIYKKQVYESVIAGNSDTPGTTSNWLLILDNFIGISERIKYNGQKIVLEYALNRWFGTVFRQPGAGTSDIYLSNNAVQVPVFRVGATEGISSRIFSITSSESVINAYNVGVVNNFTINVPLAVYNALDPSPVNRDKIFRQFTNQYVPAGLNYIIITY